MLVLQSLGSAGAEQHLIVIFGSGMIGSNISECLLNHECQLLSYIEFDWKNEELKDVALCKLETLVNAQLPKKISIVWSAGVSAFHSTSDETDKEHLSFLKVVEFAKGLSSKNNHLEMRFHYMSSAGGLFEGQRVINAHSRPSPIRPYGDLKLRQERLLLDTFAASNVHIYRPSSVYGPMEQVRQKGLINNLVGNARSGNVTTLDSHVMALRDYVFVGDIGRFVAKNILRTNQQNLSSSISFLASARCASIFEVVKKIEMVLKVKLRYRLDDSFGNSQHITFNSSVLPANWYASSLEVGIRQFLIVKGA